MSKVPTDVRSVVPDYRPSGSLDALQELVDVAAQVPHEVARQAGLSTSELHSLRHLMDTPMGPVELARALGVTSAASSGVVDRLVARGHAQRRPHPDDGRRTEVVITESGRVEVFALPGADVRGARPSSTHRCPTTSASSSSATCAAPPPRCAP